MDDIKPLAVSSTTSTTTSIPLVHPPRRTSNPLHAWRSAHSLARKDWLARWQLVCILTGAFLWCAGIIASLVVLNTIATYGYGTGMYATPTACQPDGSFNLVPAAYRYWSLSGVFQITLGSGKLSFTQAKAVDVVWHVCVGRGGQALMSIISWSVFVKYVTTSMEVTPITLNTYRMIFLQNESLFFGIPRLIRDFTRRRGLHSRLAMVFMVVSMVFILAFPTLANAMTGYSGNVEAYVRNHDNNYDAFSGFNIALYTVHDGERINKTNDYVVTVLDYATDWAEPLLAPGYTPASLPHRFVYDCSDSIYSNWVSEERCMELQFLYNISDYVGLHGFNGNKDTSSKFQNFTLPSPILNISATYIPSHRRWESTYLNVVDSLNGSANFPVNGTSYPDPEMMRWISQQGQFYSRDDIVLRGTCQTVENYKWGFSFVQLNIVLILIGLWTIGIVAMWVSATRTMARRGRNEVAGRYKAVLELSDAMREQLTHVEEAEKNLNGVTEGALRHRIKKELNGGSISYSTPLLPDKQPHTQEGVWQRLIRWLKSEKYWLGTLVLSAVGAIVSGVVGILWLLVLSVVLEVALVFAMAIGSTQTSRVVFLLWSFLILGTIPVTIMAVVF